MYTATINVFNLDKFEEKFNRLNKKALRLGMAGMRYSVGNDITRVECNAFLEPIVKIVGKEVEIEYQDTIVIDGDWSLVATLDHKENLIKVVPSMVLPEVYRNEERKMVCDHCKQARYRLETFVLVNSNGGYVQLGRQCLGDYLGIDPDRYLHQIDFIKELSLDDEEMTGSKMPNMIDLESYLTNVAAMIREYGFLSSKAAKENFQESTATKSWQHIFDQLENKYGKKVHVTLVDSDKMLAKQTIVWLGSLKERKYLNDYLLNLSRIAENNFVTVQSIAFAASAINAMQNDTERKNREIEVKRDFKHLGEVGEKLTVDVVLVSSYGYENDYGYSYKHIFTDQSGNTLIWNTGNNGLEINKAYRMTATVKAHNEYKGMPQTVVTRAKLK